MIVLLLNLVVWIAGLRYFQQRDSSNRRLYFMCMTAYLGVAVAAFFVDHEQNLFNHYYLDVRWPHVYRVAHPDAIDELRLSPRA